MKAIYIEQTGGPEVLKYGDMPKPELQPGHALIKVAASGVNFIDTYFRSGLYKIPLPAILGSEGAGTVEEGTNFKKGDRVAWAMSRGSYAEYAVVPESLLVALPGRVSFVDGAAAMLQGMTAHYLTHSTYPLKKGDTVLIHAAAGGTGRLLVQIAKMLGARVIGTVGTEAKAQLAREAGADETILYSTQDFVGETKRLTEGKGVDVVYDSVGNTTLMKSLDCLRPRGMAVSFGQSSGAVPAFEPLLLTQKGSLFFTRPSLPNYISDRRELDWRSADIFQWIEEKKLVLRIDHEYQLAYAEQAHRDLEGRQTSGKLILLI
ncbi:MAG TPA: quinone oxidoreductase [Bryobacteraceae bacterium]|jgi:NADPH2:quinone reductase|nr:quinone oxidoreductase [Bryobacteraceae bacterium]